jgi:hypothetical protein
MRGALSSQSQPERTGGARAAAELAPLFESIGAVWPCRSTCSLKARLWRWYGRNVVPASRPAGSDASTG